MKPEELQLGDYVVHGFGHTGKVTAIDKGIITVHDKGLDDGEGNCEVTFALNEIKPIPLTSEFLDKNFDLGKMKNGLPMWTYYTDYIELHISEFNDGLYEILVDEIEMSGLPTWLMYVSNVHELQHALRLVGVEKEIEL